VLDRYDLRSPFEAHGIFHAPDDANEKITGTVTRHKRGIELTTSPSLMPFDPRRLFNTTELNIPVLHGKTTKGPCTLIGLQSPLEDGLADVGEGQDLVFRRFRVDSCVAGILIPSVDAPVIESARFAYSGIHQWIPRQAFFSTTRNEITLRVPMSLPAAIDVCSLASKDRITLYTNATLSSNVDTGHAVSMESWLEIEPQVKRSLKYFIELGNRFENFFSLLLGSSVILRSAQLSAGDESGWLLRNAHSKPQRLDRSIWIICDSSQLTQAALRWLSISEEFKDLETLVYWTIRKSTLFPGTEFLSLAQAIESLHRLTDRSTVTATSCFRQVLRDIRDEIKFTCGQSRLAERLHESIEHANEPNFHSRLESLLSRLPGDLAHKLLGDPAEFEQTLRQTRHARTHIGIKRKSKVLTDDGEIFLFNQKLHAFLRILMLIYLGFPAEQVFPPIYTQSRKWH
jgi:hypothetical protein